MKIKLVKLQNLLQTILLFAKNKDIDKLKEVEKVIDDLTEKLKPIANSAYGEHNAKN